MLYNKEWEKQIPEVQFPQDPWRKVLLDAADYIEEHGWCQNRLFDGDSVCARGAILRATSPEGLYYNSLAQQADGALTRHLQPWVDEGVWGDLAVPEWNNAPERTQEEVVATLRAVARS